MPKGPPPYIDENQPDTAILYEGTPFRLSVRTPGTAVYVNTADCCAEVLIVSLHTSMTLRKHVHKSAYRAVIANYIASFVILNGGVTAAEYSTPAKTQWDYKGTPIEVPDMCVKFKGDDPKILYTVLAITPRGCVGRREGQLNVVPTQIRIRYANLYKKAPYDIQLSDTPNLSGWGNESLHSATQSVYKPENVRPLVAHAINHLLHLE